MLTAITMDRVLTILFPLNLVHIRMKHAKIITAIGWSVCTFLTLLPVFGIPYFGDAFFGRTGNKTIAFCNVTTVGMFTFFIIKRPEEVFKEVLLWFLFFAGVCLPFQVSNEKLPGWEYSVFIFLVVNFIAFLAIFIG